MFSIVLVMSLILGSGFDIASQTAMAVIITYPYTNSLYDNVNNNNNTSSYGNFGYNNESNNSNNDTNDDKYSYAYSNYEFSKYPTKVKLYQCQKGPFEGFFTCSVEFCIAANNNTTVTGSKIN
ncbi:MAG: hypothetical protein ACXWE0_04150 [Nitrososphaeraceae archaeon]